uniref:Nucleotide-binding alpha-beta plait domain-containing protein n=1 Tax=Tanacetum cinerariifolium TaxID=118510 RepID=A0A699H3V6_TANCI|nr:nucleotide-binding alpha-beta plait domain-containing protein [Tanacetum cinerariifolium]
MDLSQQKSMVMGDRISKDHVHQIDDIDQLLKNLCTILIGRMRLHANVARFLRTTMNKRSHSSDGAKGVYKTRAEDTHKELGQRMKTNSYAGVVKTTPELVIDSESALVLDYSCMLQRDFSMSLMGKVKEFASLSTLPDVLAKEVSENLKIRYLGGFWVLIDFQSNSAKENFQNHTRVGSWFALLQHASKTFIIDERVTWVDIEGIPLQAWTQNTFAKIASKWGEFIQKTTICHVKYIGYAQKKYLDGFLNLWRKSCLQTNLTTKCWMNYPMMDEELQKETKLNVHSYEEEVEEGPESSFVHEQVNIEAEVRKSEDTFGIYDILNKKVDNKEGKDNSDSSIPYPPGFTPLEDGEVDLNKNVDKEEHVKGVKQKDSSIR